MRYNSIGNVMSNCQIQIGRGNRVDLYKNHVMLSFFNCGSENVNCYSRNTCFDRFGINSVFLEADKKSMSNPGPDSRSNRP